MSLVTFGKGGLYITTHKVASISCINSLFHSPSFNAEENRNIHTFKDVENKRGEYSFIFSFVRNPLDRAISAWKQNKYFEYTLNFDEYIKHISTLDLENHVIDYNQKSTDLDKIILNHSMPLSKYFEIDSKIPEEIFIGKIENIEDDWTTIGNKILEIEGLQLGGIFFINESKYPDLKPEINSESKELISKIYERDFVNFNYEFPK